MSNHTNMKYIKL